MTDLSLDPKMVLRGMKQYVSRDQMQHYVENQQTLARTTLGCYSKPNSSTLVQMFQLPSDTVEKVTGKNRRRNSNGFVKADGELGVKGCRKVTHGTEFDLI